MLIILMTLFLQEKHDACFRETLFSQFIISCSIILILEIIGEDFIFGSLSSCKITRNLGPRE